MRYLLLSLLLSSLSSFSTIYGQVNVLTANYNNYRTGANTSETLLNVSNVNATQFGRIYSFPVDGQIYAQPLYVHGVNMPGHGVLNVLYVATLNSSVYAFDADATTGTAPLWHMNFASPVNPISFYASYTDILDQVGILSTPVVDPTTDTIYVVHYAAQDSKYAYYLHALDLLTGAEKFNGPVQIQANIAGTGWGGSNDAVNGVLSLDPAQHLQRPGLLLLNGQVYIAFGSHGDLPPWHGWLLGYDAATLKQTLVFNTTPSDAGSSIWQGGRGIAADTAGSIYFSTGNGGYDGATKWGESVIRLTPAGAVADWFTPSQFSELNDMDNDLGSNGPILIPGTNLIVAAGKEGIVSVIDKTNMGHEVTSNTQIVQSFQAGDGGGFSIFNAALWPVSSGQMLYLWAYNEPLRAYRMVNGQFVTTAQSANSQVTNMLPFSGFSVSSNGNVPYTGVLWATSSISGTLPAAGSLHAFDATNVATELWNSDKNSSRDVLGNFTKFANPTVANGKVFVPTDSDQIAVYGLLPSVPGIASVVNAASFTPSSLAPGELVTVFGNSVGPASQSAGSPQNGKFPSTLAGLTVSFGGTPAPLLYGASGQINAVVPFSVAGKSSVQMTVSTSSGPAYNVTLPVTDAAPAFFTQNSSGSGAGSILNNADLSLNTSSNPAPRGSVVAIYITGAGVTNPSTSDGQIVSSAGLPLIVQPVTVSIGGLPAKVVYQGAAPGIVAGVTQVNVGVPQDVTPGAAVPVTLMVGSEQSLNTVTMSVN